MKKITTILLMACLVVFQYGRQVSYWECRLSNALETGKEKCDCEQLINATTEQNELPPAPVHHKHFHLDDSFFPSCMVLLKGSSIWQRAAHGVLLPVFINLNLASRLERPPQMIG